MQAQGRSRRNLVVLYLNGGNDSLSTVIPYNDPQYASQYPPEQAVRQCRVIDSYQSRTTDFWAACDGLGGPETYRLGGSFNDGKGEPGQSSRVSHGSPVARVRRINVLNTGTRGA